MKRRIATGILLGCLLLASLWVVTQARMWEQAAAELNQRLSVDSLWHTEETGGRHGYFLEPDSLYWLGMARAMQEGGSWRIRHTNADNAPEGRPVYWSQSIAWLIVLLAEAAKPFTLLRGDYLREAAALWVNPLILILTLGIGGWVLRQRFGLLPALFFIVSMAGMPYAVANYEAMRPDHQSLHVTFLCLEVIFLLAGGMGFERAGASEAPLLSGWSFPGAGQSRKWFLAAGIMAGCGFWIGATPQILAHGLILGGFVILRFLSPALFQGFSWNDAAVNFVPIAWRHWGRWAAGTSLFWYLVEYFPNHLQMRPEINQPLYALSLWLLGLLISGFPGAGTPESRDMQWGRFVLLLAALLIVLIVPFHFHAMRDPGMARWHNFITEFYSVPRFSGGRVFQHLWESGLLYFVPLLFVLMLALRPVSPASLLYWSLSWLLALGFFLLFYLQMRWYGFAAVFLILFGALFLAGLFVEFRGGRLVVFPWILLIALGGQAVYFGVLEYQKLNLYRQPNNVAGELLEPLLQQRYSLRAGEALRGQNAVILADPDLTPFLQYYGRVPGVESFYWENRAGLYRAADIFSQETEAGAIAALRRNHISHVMTVQGSKIAEMLFFVREGRFDPSAAGRGFLSWLFEGQAESPALKQPSALIDAMPQSYRVGNHSLSSHFKIWQVGSEP